MKLLALLAFAFALTACSQSDEEHARTQARQSAEQLKHDSEKAFQKAEIETKKAGRELNEDLEKAREKARRALNVQPDKGDTEARPDSVRPDNSTRR
jgi:hypothetical protein